MRVILSHFDTCLSCYVQDWSGTVIGVPVYAETTYAEIKEGLESELASIDSDDLETVSDDDVARGIADAFDGVDLAELFDSSLESAEESDDCDGPHAWFRVTVEPETPEEESALAAAEDRRDAEIKRLHAAYSAEREAIAELRALYISNGAASVAPHGSVVPWRLECAHGLAARRRALGMES